MTFWLVAPGPSRQSGLTGSSPVGGAGQVVWEIASASWSVLSSPMVTQHLDPAHPSRHPV
ncbi:hypothetical protein [Actinomyces sp. 2119]|uniref:hypothetical protein n=1 Tax=Actinomyces sp. 2119 TaxID=2321393 RepID=UPI0011C41CC3|nr:hypothetical protein [Actinomyces sp. 2119]